MHPLTIRQLAWYGFYESYTAAAHAVQRLRRRKFHRLRYRGGAVLSESGVGRPLDIYCNGWKPNHVRQELYLTDFVLALRGQPIEWLRGPFVDKKLLPDATMFFPDGARHHVELDTGSMSERQVRERWTKYALCRDALLIVTLSEARLEQVLEWSGAVSKIASVTVLKEFVQNPMGEVWRTWNGDRVSLEITSGKTRQQASVSADAESQDADG